MEDFTDNDAHNYDNYDDDIVMGVNSVTSLTTCYKSINGATSETVNEVTSEITNEIISETTSDITSEITSEATSETTSETTPRFTSPVWEHFSLLKKERKAKCDHCKGLLSHKKGTGTSHLRRHINSCQKYKRLLSNPNGFNSGSNGQTKLRFNVNRTSTKEIVRKDVADMVVLDELSFQFVEGWGFRKLIRGLLPDFIVSADSIKRDIMNTYNKRKSLIKNILQNVEGKISLTCDCWTSLQQLGYLAITAHFFDKEWNLISIILSFVLIPYPHTGINIANCIKAEVDGWSITTKVIR